MIKGWIILLYMFSFATGCMTLVLSVVFHLREAYQWTKYFIVFHSSLLLVIVLQVLSVFVDLFLGPTAAFVSTVVINALLAANISFFIAFVPFFTRWLLAQPLRSMMVLFITIASVFMVISIFDLIFPSVWIFQTLMVIIFVFSLSFSIGVLMKNLKTISNVDVRTVSKAIIILSFTMLPLLITSIIFPTVRYITYPIYFMAFSIILLVFLFIYFKKMPHHEEKELTFSSVETFNITEREYSVITLIKEGLTNKEIAYELNISVNTVNNHIANIFSKTKVRSRIDLLNLLS